MDKNIDKEEAKAGTIFLDWRNNFDYVVNGTKDDGKFAEILLFTD